MKETIDRLHNLGLEWGYGDSRNPEEMHLNIMHTNCIRLWFKWKDIWRIYLNGDISRLIYEFCACETEKDIDDIIITKYKDDLYG